MNDFPHYFKKLPPGCTHVDVYRVLDLFGVTDAPLQHAIKKLLCAGARGAKDQAQDIAEAIATLQRWQQMREEEQSAPASENAERPFGPITSDPADAERNIREKEDAERAAYLVRWKGAPAHATHLAEGYDGRCWWYSREPWPNNPEPCVEWIGGLIDYAGDNLLGSVRCEPRPVQGVGP